MISYSPTVSSTCKNHIYWIVEDIAINLPRRTNPNIAFGLLRIMAMSTESMEIESIRESIINPNVLLTISPNDIGVKILNLFGHFAKKQFRDTIVYIATNHEVENHDVVAGVPGLILNMNPEKFHIKPTLISNIPDSAVALETPFEYRVYFV